jgi:hypothetical protein
MRMRLRGGPRLARPSICLSIILLVHGALDGARTVREQALGILEELGHPDAAGVRAKLAD